MKVLESGSSEEKIRMLESLADTSDGRIVQKMISMLDDEDIRVRGESFSSLVLNGNDILQLLVQGLDSDNKNIRGHVALVLANRKEVSAIPEIVRLVSDERSSVRACALGALGYLGARNAKSAIRQGLADPNIEVKKSAIKAAIDIGEPIQEEMMREILRHRDAEIERLVRRVTRE